MARFNERKNYPEYRRSYINLPPNGTLKIPVDTYRRPNGEDGWICEVSYDPEGDWTRDNTGYGTGSTRAAAIKSFIAHTLRLL